MKVEKVNGYWKKRADVNLIYTPNQFNQEVKLYIMIKQKLIWYFCIA